jgi:hypothetical protein
MDNLTDIEKAKRWAAGWKRAGARLEELRDEDIRNTNTVDAMVSLSDAFNSALHFSPAQNKTSGLVDFYRILLGRGGK